MPTEEMTISNCRSIGELARHVVAFGQYMKKTDPAYRKLRPQSRYAKRLLQRHPERLAFDRLEAAFKAPKNWKPGKQGYFSHFRRIPRKLKKAAKYVPQEFLDGRQKLWYLQGLRNPDLNRFLIKMILKAS